MRLSLDLVNFQASLSSFTYVQLEGLDNSILSICEKKRNWVNFTNLQRLPLFGFIKLNFMPKTIKINHCLSLYDSFKPIYICMPHVIKFQSNRSKSKEKCNQSGNEKLIDTIFAIITIYVHSIFAGHRQYIGYHWIVIFYSVCLNVKEIIRNSCGT